ncbi:hypothetical protein MPC1_100013 [Methylocella tundrae]|nr:hypothetical protein MPC1_100013 [Methylocella tundrae]
MWFCGFVIEDWARWRVFTLAQPFPPFRRDSEPESR